MNRLTYQRKPVQVEAMWFDGSVQSATSIIDWVLASSRDTSASWRCRDPEGCGGRSGDLDHDLTIQTPRSSVTVGPGLFVLQQPDGEFHPCEARMFHQNYSLVEDGDYREYTGEG